MGFMGSGLQGEAWTEINGVCASSPNHIPTTASRSSQTCTSIHTSLFEGDACTCHFMQVLYFRELLRDKDTTRLKGTQSSTQSSATGTTPKVQCCQSQQPSVVVCYLFRHLRAVKPPRSDSPRNSQSNALSLLSHTLDPGHRQPCD